MTIGYVVFAMAFGMGMSVVAGFMRLGMTEAEAKAAVKGA